MGAKMAMKSMKAMKAMKAMKSMKKAMKAMKSMKAMKKAMKVSVIAKGKRAKAAVFAGGKEKTSSGLTKAKLMKSKTGKIVSKQKSSSAKKNYAGSKAQAWANACKKARKELGCKGLVPFGGKSAAGKALYAKAKAIYNA